MQMVILKKQSMVNYGSIHLLLSLMAYIFGQNSKRLVRTIGLFKKSILTTQWAKKLTTTTGNMDMIMYNSNMHERNQNNIYIIYTKRMIIVTVI